MKYVMSCIIAFCISLVIIGAGLWQVYGPVTEDGAEIVFVVPENDTEFDISKALYTQKLIRSESAFRWLQAIAFAGRSVVPGGYRLRPTMSSLHILSVITDTPQLVWVHIREGLRKEQYAEILGTSLGWSPDQEREWNAYNSDSAEYREGVYFPDTYLLPTDEPVASVAKRFIDRFNEKLSPLLDKFTAKNIKWTTAVKIASLIDRESGGDSDKALIAGVIWKRLEKDMRLEIDATLQYIRGNSEDGWWPKVVPADKYLDSLYNTYRYDGLPPGPISNPGLKAIEAVLNPEETDCIFYLHAPDRQIHCAETYEEHLANIDTYLR